MTPQALTVQCGVPFTLVNRALANLLKTGAGDKWRGAYEARPAISPVRAAAVPELLPPMRQFPAIGERLERIINTGRLD